VPRARGRAHVPEVTVPIHDFRHPAFTGAEPYNRAMNDDPACVTAAPVRFKPAMEDAPEITPAVARGFSWLSVAALATWVFCGLWPIARVVQGRFPSPAAGIYVACFLAYGAALSAVLFLPRRQDATSRTLLVSLAAVETVTAIVMNMLTVKYISGSGAGVGFVVIVAAQLPYFLGATATWIWIALQSIVLTWYWFGGNPVEAVTIGGAIAGFQVFAAATSILAINEGRARNNLARVNAELNATRELLAESSRTEERLRISRDLHDTLGHHLTALSVQLDVAARLSEGKAAEHIQQSHAITRLLLADVRDVVSSLRGTGRLDLAQALRALAVQPAGARIHLDIPESVEVADAARGEAIVRAAQEVITNTARHAHARNLWIRLTAAAGGVELSARDDGRGAAPIVPGNGLLGMRERFAQHGGRVEFNSPSGGGFEVRAFMPLPESA
jgi:signal transduction histidine kinase